MEHIPKWSLGRLVTDKLACLLNYSCCPSIWNVIRRCKSSSTVNGNGESHQVCRNNRKMVLDYDLQIDGLKASLMGIEDVMDVTEFLLDYFFSEEPLGKALGLDVEAEVRPWLAEVVRHQVQENTSIVIRSSASDNQLVAVCLNDVERNIDDAGDVTISTSVNEKYHPAMWKITRLLMDLVKDVDLFDRFHINAYVLLEILCVHPRYAGRGLAGKMIDITGRIARESGHSLIISEATSGYSSSAFLKAGYTIENSIDYADYSLDGISKPFASRTGVHTGARLMIKQLDPLT